MELEEMSVTLALLQHDEILNAVTKTTILIIQTAATKIIRIITLTLIVITKITILKLIHQLTIIVVLF